MARVLVIDDEESIRFSFKTHLMNEAYEVMTAEDYSSGVEAVACFNPDLVITDVILGGRTGVDILRKVKNMGMQCPVILITGEPNIETAADGVRLGAFDYLPKPIRKQTLLRITSHALRHKKLINEKSRVESENVRYPLSQDIIFKSFKDAIVTVDNNMQILEANKKFINICGFLPEKIVGTNITEIKALCNKSCLYVLKETLRSKSSISEFRSECMHHDHPNQIVLLTGSPLKDHEDKVLGAILVIRDITRLNILDEN
jgi:two-component system, NtrC family, response regulator HydG